MPRTILNISTDETLLNGRGKLLRKAGFDVVPASNLEEVVRACEGREIDAVVLGHFATRREKRRVLETVRVHCQPGTPTVGVYTVSQTEADGTDYAIATSEGPTRLVNTLQRILIRHFGEFLKLSNPEGT